MASLKDIAGELGVSFSLVSKVLNGRMGNTGVSRATREAILKKAKELDYRPNHTAVALQSGRKGSVAVFLHGMGTPGSGLRSRFLDGLTDAFEETGLRLWLRFFKSDDEFRAICNKRLAHEVDGLIVGGVEHPGILTDLERMEEHGLPVVSVFCGQPHCASPTNIAVDYRAQCYLTTKHLIEKGCTRIAHFHMQPLRTEGYVEAHREAGLPIWPRLDVSGHLFFENGIQAAATLLDSGEKFDGIVCGSDAQALGAIRELRRRGIRVPEDVCITGVDDSPMAAMGDVTLTTATSEMSVCGRLAVETLLKKIAGEAVSPIIVQPTLVVRDSTGP